MIKFLLYKILPTLTLVFFILIMNSGQTFQARDNILTYLPQVRSNINEDQWDKASQNLKSIQSAWGRVVKRIQFSVERDEINNLQHSLARLKGYIEAQDKSGAYAELEEVKETWEDLGE